MSMKMDMTMMARTVNRIAEYLGNSECRTYVLHDEDGHVTLTNSAGSILHGIEHQYPVNQLLNDAVEAQHTKHGCGRKTLAFMAGIWLLQAQKLLHMGMSVTEITAGYDRAADELSNILETLASPVDFAQKAVNNGKVSFSKELYHEDSHFAGSLNDRLDQTKDCEEIGNLGTSHFPQDEKTPPTPDPNISLIDLSKYVTKSHYSPQTAFKPDISHVLSKNMEMHDSNICANDDEFDSCFEEIGFRETDLTGKKTVHVDDGNVSEVIESGTVIGKNHKQYQQHGSFKKNSRRCSSSASNVFDVESEEEKGWNQTEESVSQEAASEKLQNVVLSKNYIENKVKSSLTARKTEKNTWSRYHSKNFKIMELKTDLTGNNGLDWDVHYYPFTASNKIPSCNPCTKSIPKETFTVNIGQVLKSFRNRDPSIFPLLQEVYNNQNLKTTDEEITFESNKIHCVHIGGLGQLSSCVKQGLLIKVSSDNLQSFRESEYPHRILLVNGDLTPHFMHTGSKTIQRRNIISGTYIPLMSRAEKWYGDILSLLKELQVTVVFTKGIVDETLSDACRAQNIILISMVPSKVILAIGEACQINAATYILECSEVDVGIDVHLNIFTSDRLAFAVVKAKGIMFQSVVICHPSEQEALVRQEQFWKCVCSMEHTIASKVLLRGGGQTELHCAEVLLQRTLKSTEDQSYINLVSCLADGLVHFHSVVNRKMGHTDVVLYDDLPSKLYAWNTAIQLVKIFLNLSQEIITGISDIS